MGKPVTPLVGADTFVIDEESRVCLIQRADNGLWALPGGCQDLGETPRQCAEREFTEETGYRIEVIRLLGVFSSIRYEYETYPYKDNEFCHLLFWGRVLDGSETTSEETKAVGWFREDDLPRISDGHEKRIRFGFRWLKNQITEPYFE